MIPISEFAALCGVSTRTIERHIADGRIVPITHTPGGHARFSPQQMGDYQRGYRWRDQNEKSPGSTFGTGSTTSSGTTGRKGARDVYRFAQETRAKREVLSRRSLPPTALPSLDELLS